MSVGGFLKVIIVGLGTPSGNPLKNEDIAVMNEPYPSECRDLHQVSMI
jgi:hypothetical protein